MDCLVFVMPNLHLGFVTLRKIEQLRSLTDRISSRISCLFFSSLNFHASSHSLPLSSDTLSGIRDRKYSLGTSTPPP
jgi:hypothetical protein